MELFAALMQGRIPERVPVVCNLFEQGAHEMNMSIKEYYSKSEYVVEGQLKLRNKYQNDVVWAAQYAARTAEMLGSKFSIFALDGPPNAGDLIIKNYKDIEELSLPQSLEDIPAFAIQKETLKMLKAEVAGSCPVCMYVIGSFSLPAILMGIEKWLELLLIGPEELKRLLLTKCSDFTIRLIEEWRATGADMLAYSNAVGTTDFFNPQQIEDLALEWIARDYSTPGAAGMSYFSGGGEINKTIPFIKRKAGVTSFYLHPNDDIAEAKAMLKGEALLAAPINDIMLLNWNDDEIHREVKRIMSEGMQGGGFIFGTFVMPFKIPSHKISTLVRAAHEFGTYSKAI